MTRTKDNKLKKIYFYPDDLMIDENVIFSFKQFFPLPNMYFITNKRVIRKNLISKKYDEIEISKINEVHMEQNKIMKIFNLADISIMHSNYKNNVPLMRRKYFILKYVKKPYEVFRIIDTIIKK